MNLKCKRENNGNVCDREIGLNDANDGDANNEILVEIKNVLD